MTSGSSDSDTFSTLTSSKEVFTDGDGLNPDGLLMVIPLMYVVLKSNVDPSLSEEISFGDSLGSVYFGAAPALFGRKYVMLGSG